MKALVTVTQLVAQTVRVIGGSAWDWRVNPVYTLVWRAGAWKLSAIGIRGVE